MRSSRLDVADQRVLNPGKLSRHFMHMNAAAYNVAANVLLLVHPDGSCPHRGMRLAGRKAYH